MRRRVTYRPSRASSIAGLVFGVVFLLIGVFLIIPAFGAFGILWTLMAGVIAGINGYYAFGKKYIGPEIHIEEDAAPAPENAPGESAEERLAALRRLYDRQLISDEEYEQKRAEILRQL